MTAFCKVVVKATGGGGAGASYFQHWLQSEDGTIDDPPDLCTLIAGLVEDHLAPVLTNSWSLGRLDWTFWATDVSVPTPSQIVTVTPIIGGESVTNSLAPRQTMLINYKSMSGILGNKRCYVGRWSEAHNTDNGVPDGTAVAAVQAYADHTLFEASVNGRAWFYSVVRLQRATTTGGTVYYRPIEWARLTSHLVQTKWAFLRSRDVGHGI